jgi:hypothetical protein
MKNRPNGLIKIKGNYLIIKETHFSIIQEANVLINKKKKREIRFYQIQGKTGLHIIILYQCLGIMITWEHESTGT